MNKYFAELIGTFAIVFLGTLSIVIDQKTNGSVTNLGISAVFGLIVAAMIYIFGSISGAHFNPAVTVSFAIAKKFEKKEIIPYIICQFVGGFLASVVLKILFENNELLGATIPSNSNFQAFGTEIFITFGLMLLILKISSTDLKYKFIAPIAIGLYITIAAFFAGPICGASMNPARSFGPAIASGHLEQLWIYLTAPVLGAIMAVYTWNYIPNKKIIE